MFNVLSKRKTFLVVAGLIHFGLLAGWVLLNEYHNANAPRFPDSQSGRIYSLAFHGTYGYLTRSEYFTFWALPMGCIANLIVGSLLDYYYFPKKIDIDWKNPKRDI